jgi:hypothetical protein
MFESGHAHCITADAIGRFVQFVQTRLAPLPR